MNLISVDSSRTTHTRQCVGSSCPRHKRVDIIASFEAGRPTTPSNNPDSLVLLRGCSSLHARERLMQLQSGIPSTMY
jgi:hypothetical protein